MSRLPAKDPSLVQVLSLYLLLLAFFILLFNASRFDQGKADAVTESLSSTFRMHGVPEHDPVVRSSDQGQAPGAEQILDSFADLIRTELAVAKVEKLRRGRLLRVSLGADELFNTDTADIRSDRLGLIQYLAGFLGKKPSGYRHKVQIFFTTDWVTPDQMKNAVPLSIRRAANLSRSLMQHNAVPGTVSGGIRHGRGSQVQLIYRVDQELRPEDLNSTTAGGANG